MDKETLEYWTGSLKTAIIADRLLKESKNLGDARSRISELKKKLELIHVESMTKAMETLID